jgi:2-phosphosulfolactate phosphatase
MPLAASLRRVIDVAFTPADARAAEVTVVIDVLRATSTIVQALDAGYRAVIAADGLDRARSLAGPGRVLAGERMCQRPSGFRLGNSPSETLRPLCAELVIATTNGAPAIVRATELSEQVLIGALLNLDALVDAIGGRDVQLLCSGTDGRPALEDAYAAGRIAQRLPGSRTDAAHMAQAIARAHPSPHAALAASADAAVLRTVGLERDIDWCAQESITTVVPAATTTGEGVATVSVHSQTSMQNTKHLAGNL